jgi:serine/threonine-protein kinase HipA
MNQIASVKDVNVGINFGYGVIPVGRLASRSRQLYFEYNRDFIERGLDISPFRLALKSGLISLSYEPFEGLPGVFNDSLPDGWGRLLFDRFSRARGVSPADLSPLDRLAHVGQSGMGALVYEPDHSSDENQNDIVLDVLAAHAADVLAGNSDDVLSELIALNGSSAGARPKILVAVNDTRDRIIYGGHDLREGYMPWLVKFPNIQDGLDAGAIEYVYALMAKEAGIVMPDVHLFPAQRGAGYFASKRFDRDGKNRYHVHTVCGLLHSDFRTPSLDYEDLIALTGGLTRDVREVEQMYRLAVFNVLAHNRDDHSKNFSFLMKKEGQWQLAPAYDLTFSSGPGGEQSMMIVGEGRNPGVTHLRKLGESAGLSSDHVSEVIDATKSSLSKWSELATQYGVSSANIELINKTLI